MTFRWARTIREFDVAPLLVSTLSREANPVFVPTTDDADSSRHLRNKAVLASRPEYDGSPWIEVPAIYAAKQYTLFPRGREDGRCSKCVAEVVFIGPRCGWQVYLPGLAGLRQRGFPAFSGSTSPQSNVNVVNGQPYCWVNSFDSPQRGSGCLVVVDLIPDLGDAEVAEAAGFVETGIRCARIGCMASSGKKLEGSSSSSYPEQRRPMML